MSPRAFLFCPLAAESGVAAVALAPGLEDNGVAVGATEPNLEDNGVPVDAAEPGLELIGVAVDAAEPGLDLGVFEVPDGREIGETGNAAASDESPCGVDALSVGLSKSNR